MFGSLVMVVAATLSGAFADVIDLDLKGQSYDPKLFRPDPEESSGRWEVKNGVLQAVIPEGPAGRPPTSFAGLFRLEGDFEVSADYQLVAWPKPVAAADRKQRNVANIVEIVIKGPTEWCVVSRKHLPAGERISLYGELPRWVKCISELFPVSGSTGRLAARRKGGMIYFYRSEGGAPEVEIGLIPFGAGTVSDVSLRVHAMNTTDALDVRFSRLHVAADEIDRILGGNPPRRSGRPWALVTVVTLTLSGAVAVMWIALRRRAAPSPAPNALGG